MKITQWFQGLSKKQKALVIGGGVVLCLLVAAVIYVAVLFGKLGNEDFSEDEIHINDLDATVGEGYTNFVLFGGDSRSGETERYLNTDSIIIVSLNNKTKEIKLVSVYRDTLLDLSDGRIRKCNSAYSNGGAKQAINMLNMNLDLDIKKYATVNFAAVVDLVDMVGGVEIDVSEKERKAVNRYIAETARVTGNKANYLSQSGLQTLDGVQATTYARIRKGVGDDFARTARQRLIIEKVAQKALKSDLSTINKIINELFPQISTNFTLTEILSYAKSFKKYSIKETTGFPIVKGSGTIPGKGSSVYPITLESNVSQLHEFLYGTVGYQPSSKVVEISAEIAYIVGNRQPDKDSSWSDNSSSDDDDDDDKGNGQTGGDDQTGGDQTGGDQTGGDQTGGDQTGGDQTGGDQTGGDQTGGDQTGGDQTGGDQTGGDQTGGDQTGGDQTGGDQTGGDQTGGDQTGGDQTGGDQTGGDQTGGDTPTGGGVQPGGNETIGGNGTAGGNESAGGANSGAGGSGGQ